MSYDRQLDQVCQHTVHNETLYVEADRRTIVPIRSIAAGNNVTVILNDAVEVPPEGVRSAPQGVGTWSGPFDIRAGINDLFQVRVNQEATLRTVVVPANPLLPVDQLVAYLNAANLSMRFINQNNRVSFEGLQTGGQASLFFPTTSTLASTLGISLNREFRGKELYPGWSLIAAPRTVNLQPRRYIVFDRPLASQGDFALISYTTTQPECRRCGGLGVENDWRYTQTGDVVETRDEALLIQECLKIFYTEEGSNPFHVWYGTRLGDMIGQKNLGSVSETLISSEIYRSFTRWQSIKRQQEIAVGQEVSDEEYPQRILSVEVTPSTEDPTVYFVSVQVQNRAGGIVQIERGIKIPQPEDLLGSSQQQGIFRQSLRDYILTG